jgi:Domain of Unknown Function (DUF928)
MISRLIHFALGLGILGLGLSGLRLFDWIDTPVGAQVLAQRSTQSPAPVPSPQNPLLQNPPQPPPPPPTPPPNSTRSGGSLGTSSSCVNPVQTNTQTSTQTTAQTEAQSPAQTLVALVPIENPVLTTSEYPTFLFYVPYGSKQVKFGEFSILVGSSETTRLYRSRFTLPETPGIVSISLPLASNAAIAKDLFYHWYFKLYCQENTSSRADLEVNGWIKRVDLPDAQVNEQMHPTSLATPSVAMPMAWYDTLSDLADRLRTSPQDNALKNRWRALLALIKAEDLADKPLVGSVHLLEN